MRRIIVGLVVIAPITACLFPSVDRLGSNDASSDVVSSDGAIDAGETSVDAGMDAAIEAATYLVVDDMEQGCAPYVGQFANVTSSTIAHGGSSSCQVCCTDVNNYCTFDRGYNWFVTNPIVGKTYVAGVWMRIAPQTSSTGLAGTLVLREGTGSTYTAQSTYAETPLDQTSWTYVTTELTITDTGDGLAGYVALDKYSNGDCYLVDDITVAYGN